MRNAIAGKNGMFHLTIDGEQQDSILFDMIRNTHQLQPNHTVVAYSDNAAVMQGHAVSAFAPEQAAQPSPAHTSKQPTYLPASHFLMRLKTPEKSTI
jgi:phosphoribosylformylglycinamidine synthase